MQINALLWLVMHSLKNSVRQGGGYTLSNMKESGHVKYMTSLSIV